MARTSSGAAGALGKAGLQGAGVDGTGHGGGGQGKVEENGEGLHFGVGLCTRTKRDWR